MEMTAEMLTRPLRMDFWISCLIFSWETWGEKGGEGRYDVFGGVFVLEDEVDDHDDEAVVDRQGTNEEWEGVWRY